MANPILSFLARLMNRGPSIADRRTMREYFVRTHPIISRVQSARKTWLADLERIDILIQEDKVRAAAREAYDLSHLYERTYREAREALAKHEPPLDAVVCHEHLLAWIDALTRSNTILGELSDSNNPHKVRDARLAMRDARDAVAAYNQARQVVREKYRLRRQRPAAA